MRRGGSALRRPCSRAGPQTPPRLSGPTEVRRLGSVPCIPHIGLAGRGRRGICVAGRPRAGVHHIHPEHVDDWAGLEERYRTRPRAPPAHCPRPFAQEHRDWQQEGRFGEVTQVARRRVRPRQDGGGKVDHGRWRLLRTHHLSGTPRRRRRRRHIPRPTIIPVGAGSLARPPLSFPT